VKESKELILSEYNNLENNISSLQLLQRITENTKISVKFVLSLRVIDGKVLNVLTGTKSMQKFEKYALPTALLCIDAYPRYPMTATLHKILVHGADIIRTSIFPIGMLGEEASEATNKFYKNDQINHTR